MPQTCSTQAFSSGVRVEEVDPADGVPLRAGGLSPRLEVECPESPFDEAVEPDHVFSTGSRLRRKATERRTDCRRRISSRSS